jgi:hypothetical protein
LFSLSKARIAEEIERRTAMSASFLHIPKVRTAGTKDQDLKDRDFDDLLRRAADFLKGRLSPTYQEGTQTHESPRIKERDTDA